MTDSRKTNSRTSHIIAGPFPCLTWIHNENELQKFRYNYSENQLKSSFRLLE